MTHLVIIHALDGSAEGERILAEFERRTQLEPDLRGADRYYELHDEDHRERIVQTLTDIDAGWSDHLGFKLPG
jgi:hypothetical protein